MRVLGEFAHAGEGVLVIEKAQQADVKPSEQITLGVDVARSIAGDLNAIAVARGGWLDGVITWHSTDHSGTRTGQAIRLVPAPQNRSRSICA